MTALNELLEKIETCKDAIAKHDLDIEFYQGKIQKANEHIQIMQERIEDAKMKIARQYATEWIAVTADGDLISTHKDAKEAIQAAEHYVLSQTTEIMRTGMNVYGNAGELTDPMRIMACVTYVLPDHIQKALGNV